MIFTFYSFKGGVGRSMTMANMAEIFYRAGLSVLMVDWDLEAPGLERFFPDVQARALRHPGLMDMLAEYKRVMARPTADTKASGLPFENVNDYLVTVYPVPKDAEHRPCLSLLTAGRRDGDNFGHYSQHVLRFDWKEFYDRWAGETFFEWLRDAFSAWDIVLIDSRTGVTEIGGVCTYQLADAVMMFCASNDQNMDGSYQMARKFSNEALVKYRHGRPLQVVVVPSRVDKGDSVLVNRFQERFIKRFREFSLPVLEGGERQFWELNIPYASSYAFEESVAVRHADLASAEAIVESFLTLSRAMTRLAKQDGRIAASREAINQLSRRSIASDTTPGKVRAIPVPLPYRGLAYADVEDVPIFFGREKLTAALLERLRHSSLVVISGPSGSGKSSLIRAGLIPALQGQAPLSDGSAPPVGSDRWPVCLFAPSDRPLLRLARCLDPASSTPEGIAKLATQVGQDASAVLTALETRLGQADVDRILVVVDQFEELFTLCRDARERADFVEAVATIVASGKAAVVLAIRADYLNQAAAFEPLRAALQGDLVVVGPLNREEIRRAIVEPARLFNVEFEAGLVQRIIDDVAGATDTLEPASLSLVQDTLVQMWRLRQGGLLTHANYEAVGGIAGALAQRAETFYQGLDRQEQLLARRIFLRLVVLGEGVAATGRVVPIVELRAADEGSDTEAQAQTLQRLVEARLVSLDQDTARLAHEALIHAWPRLATWLEESHEALLVQQRLSRDAATWAHGERAPNLLYAAPQVQRALAAASQFPLSERERAFLSASQANQRAQQRSRRTKLAGTVALIVALLATSVLAVVQYSEARSANIDALLKEADRLAALSNQLLDENQEVALLLAIQAVKLTLEDEGYSTDAAESSFLQAHRPPDWMITEPDEATVSAVSADGWLAASLTETGLVGVSRVYGDSIVSIIGGHPGGVNAIAFSPDGNRLATAGNDGTAHLADVLTGEIFAVLEPHAGPVKSVAFSARGKIVTIDETGRAVLWNEDGFIITVLEVPDAINAAAFTPDGEALVTGDASGAVRFWTTEVGGLHAGFDTGQGGIVHLAMRPEGVKLLTVAGASQATTVWTYEGERIASLQSDASALVQAAFSAHSEVVLTADVEGRGYIWRAEGGELLSEFNWRQPQMQLFEAKGEEHAHVLLVPNYRGKVGVWIQWGDLADHIENALASLSRQQLNEAECLRFSVQYLPICP